MSRKFLVLSLMATALVALVFLGSLDSATASDPLLSPAIISGGMDVNGDGVITAADNSNELLAGTSIIGGLVDCNAGIGSAGSGTITGDDDCVLIPQIGSGIVVNDGLFLVADGPLRLAFSTPDVQYRVIGGRVDVSGDGQINTDDCSLSFIDESLPFNDNVGDFDVLAGNGGDENACEGGSTAETFPSFNGLVGDPVGIADVDYSDNLTTCLDGCFFGRNLVDGVVQESVPLVGPVGPAGPTGATGPAGADGADGATGATGATGPAGADGADGATGPAGADGADGATGPSGVAGAVQAETTATTVLTTSFQDLPGATLTLATQGTYVITGMFDLAVIGADDNTFLVGALEVGGAVQSAKAVLQTDTDRPRVTVSQTWVITTTADDTVIKLQAKKFAGTGTSRAYGIHTKIAALGPF